MGGRSAAVIGRDIGDTKGILRRLEAELAVAQPTTLVLGSQYNARRGEFEVALTGLRISCERPNDIDGGKVISGLIVDKNQVPRLRAFLDYHYPEPEVA